MGVTRTSSSNHRLTISNADAIIIMEILAEVWMAIEDGGAGS